MSLLLSIDTAGSACAVALSSPGNLLAIRIVDEPRAHAARLVPLIQDTLIETGVLRSTLDAVAVSKGPGSYTGLRIGVSTAKGLAFALDIPLVGVATFEALAWANRDLVQEADATTLLTVAPSRRNEAYWQLWRANGNEISPITRASSDLFADVAASLQSVDARVTLIGEAPDRLLPCLADAGLEIEAVNPPVGRAAVLGVSELGHRALAAGRTEDISTFEPFYLKEFVAKKGGSPFERLPF